ncbi:MAG: DUF3298 domain-containing protein [Oscillibacter sp.]|nr:DUF3298 domain-containing protein [Oscillibacter sp.]
MRGGDRIKERTDELRVERAWPSELPVLRAEVALPQPPWSRRVRRYYRAQSRAFLHYCEHALLPEAERDALDARAVSAPFSRRDAELTYRVTYEDDALWSVCTQSRERFPPAPPVLLLRGDTWEKRTGLPLALGDLFPAGAPWKKLLLAFAEEELRRREAAGSAPFAEKPRQALRRRFNPTRFYLTPEGLVFFYPAPDGSEGASFCVPYGEDGPQPKRMR